jgi:hypothetical protein
MELTILQDRIMRDKQRHTFNGMPFALRSDYKGNSNFYPLNQHREVEAAISDLVDLGLCDSSGCGGITEITLTKKGRDLACLMLS